MSGLRPIGSEKLEGIDKIKRIMEIARYNENTPSRLNENESTEYGISLSDGNHYEIVKEKQGYIIKRSINESVSDYIEPMKNRRYYSSYSQALKKLNLMAKEFNTLHENSEGTSLFSEQKKKFKLKLPKAKSTETPEPVVEPVPEPVTPPVTPPMEGGGVPPMGGDVPPMEGDVPPMDGDVPPMEGGDVPPMGDMGSDEGSTDASDTYDDMGSSSSSDGYDDGMGSKKDGKVSMKLIQKLIGKSSSELEELWIKSAAEGGLTTAEKKIVQKVLTIPAKKWEEALVPIYKDASAKLIERGLNPKKVMNNLVLKAGGFLTKSWYTKIPTYLVHDIPFLHLVDSIAKKFGVNNVSKELTEKIGQGYEDAKKNGKGDDYIEKSVNIIKQSKDINEFEKKSLKKMTIDTVGSVKKLKQIKNYDQLLKTQNERYKDKNNANVDLNSLINQ